MLRAKIKEAIKEKLAEVMERLPLGIMVMFDSIDDGDEGYEPDLEPDDDDEPDQDDNSVSRVQRVMMVTPDHVDDGIVIARTSKRTAVKFNQETFLYLEIGGKLHAVPVPAGARLHVSLTRFPDGASFQGLPDHGNH